MPTTDSKNKLSIWMTAVAFLLIVPFVLAIVLAGTIGHGTMSAACGGALVALAPAAVGALLGFVFGIPKTLQSSAPPAADGKAAYQVNTNLEQISDWLTKMLVGVGLAQARDVPSLLTRVARVASRAFAEDERAVSAASLVVVYFLVTGFVAGYLATRIWLTPELATADTRANPEIVRRFNQMSLTADAVKNVAPTDKHEILRFALRDLQSPAEIRAWGTAKLAEGKWADAVDAFSRALKSDGDDQNRLRSAEGLAFGALYEDPPEGFKRALATIKDYLATPGARPSANLYAYKACAHGQEYAYRKAEGAAQAELDSVRANALVAVKKAIDLDPSWKATLAGTLRPTSSHDDDDLAVFADDDDFKRLLGAGT